jgi:DNA-binding response OmpR family regulator
MRIYQTESPRPLFCPAPVLPKPVSSDGPFHVAVVDDDEGLRDTVSALLQRAGYAASTHACGASLLASLSHAPPDLLLLDLGLPGVDGFELRVSLLEHPIGAHIPVLVMSGDRSSRARAVHARAYLSKPVDPAHLLAVVAQTLAESTEAQRAARAAQALRASIADAASELAHSALQLDLTLSLVSQQWRELEQMDLEGPARFKLVGARQLLSRARTSCKTMHSRAFAAAASLAARYTPSGG